MSKKGKIIPLQPISLKSYIIDRARKLPIYKCWSIGGDGTGMHQIIVSRQKANGKLVVGFYLVDMWCIGLKDTFYREFDDEDELNDEVFDNIPDEGLLKEIDANYAQNIIYGAIEYAEDLGFSPAKDFKITEYILDDVEEIEYMDVEFGVNGKPFYMPGENDNIVANLAILRENVGVENFDYSLGINEDFDSEDEFMSDEELEMLEELDEDELEEKVKETLNSFENEQIKAIWSFNYSILLIIEETYDFDEALDKYSENKELLVKEILDATVEELPQLKKLQNEEVLSKEILLLIENYIDTETSRFILLKEYILGLQSNIDKEFSPQQFRFFSTFAEKSMVFAIAMIEEISAFKFEAKEFNKLTKNQKEEVLQYFLKEIYTDEPSDISDEYVSNHEEFSYFNKLYVNWNEDDLKCEIFELQSNKHLFIKN